MIILVSGGGGLIGSLLCKSLLAKGHEVRILSRKKKTIPGIKVFQWDYINSYLERGAFDGVSVLVHLAGEGIADKPWSHERKKELISSRVDSLNFLKKLAPKTLITLIGGSATGFYGGDTGEVENTVDSPAGKDFLAKCTAQWERAEDDFAKKHSLRLVKIRTGVVLSKNGGALPKLLLPIKAFVGSALGSGQQWMSWIHEKDLVNIFVNSIENLDQTGVINAVAPEPARNIDLVNTIGSILKKPIFFPKVPAFILKLILGEMATVVLGSAFVNTNMPKNNFKFPTLEVALEDLLG
jgi:uncharacterized protein